MAGKFSCKHKDIKNTHIFKTIKYSGVFFILAAMAVFIFRKPQPVALQLPQQIVLKQGDWIFREGTGTDSKLIQYLSGSRYSHIGIIVQTTPTVLIAHAVNDEDSTLSDQVLLSGPDDFLSISKAKSFAIARPKFLSGEQLSGTALYARRQVGTPFLLDSRNNPHFYCTTLILNAVRSQAKSFDPKWQYLDVAVFKGYYLFPESFTRENIEWIHPNQ